MFIYHTSKKFNGIFPQILHGGSGYIIVLLLQSKTALFTLISAEFLLQLHKQSYPLSSRSKTSIEVYTISFEVQCEVFY